MARLAMCNTIEHHKPFLSNGRLHTRGLANQCYIDRWQLWKDAFDTTLPAHLLFGRSQEDKVVTPITTLPLAHQHQEDMKQGNKRSTIVVRSQPVDTLLLASVSQSHHLAAGTERIVLPRRDGLHRIDMGVEQKRRSLSIVVWVNEPKVIVRTMHSQSRAVQIFLKHIGNERLFTTHRGNRYHLLKQNDRLKIGCLEIHKNSVLSRRDKKCGAKIMKNIEHWQSFVQKF